MKNLSKTTIGLIVVAAILVIFGWSSYNGLVSNDEDVNKAWANVQTAYQRRADLVPNLVSTVKGYAKHEQETLTKVTEMRTKATSINLDVSNMSADEMAKKLKEFQQVQGEFSQALKSLIAVQENYPDLKASQNFLSLQDQLEGTENRINTERTRFNEAVQSYNKKVRRFPTNILASLFGFERKSGFEAEAGAQNAPNVNFD